LSDATRDIEALIAPMARLPGLGPRSARRAVPHLLKRRGPVLGTDRAHGLAPSPPEASTSTPVRG